MENYRFRQDWVPYISCVETETTSIVEDRYSSAISNTEQSNDCQMDATKRSLMYVSWFLGKDKKLET